MEQDGKIIYSKSYKNTYPNLTLEGGRHKKRITRKYISKKRIRRTTRHIKHNNHLKK